jgi:hypothetical protein
MTQFLRRGHWRTSSLGNPYWVGEHDVSRYDWYRSSGTSSIGGDYLASRLRALHAHRGVTAMFVNPNADCPECGERVFFYQNRFGSRVYFDELGKPWPKHPCTDNAQNRGKSDSRGGRDRIEPDLRPREEVSIVDNLIEDAGLDPGQAFWEKHGVSQWPAYRILKRVRGRGSALLVLDPVSDAAKRRTFLVGRKIPSGLKEGVLVFYFRGWLNYFDMDAMEPVDVEVSRLAGPAAFVDALLGER